MLNWNLAPVYENRVFRKIRFSVYVGKQQADAKLKNDLLKHYGSPEKRPILIAMGDYSRGNRHMRNHVPVRGVGHRDLLRSFGYSLGLIDEFRSSRQCSFCADREIPTTTGPGRVHAVSGNSVGECEKFLWIDNPNKKKNDRWPCNGVLKCQSCGRIWNRGVSASCNINMIAHNAIYG